ncbi:MAG: mannonate dehydratase [Opitutales bacterium]|nr:mannonate dehydratase [Opitutales bacterium]
MPKEYLIEGFRWYGRRDHVPLSYIRQAGATDVFSSLHEIPYGEVWSAEAIKAHQKIVEEAGLKWSVVESLPVHEDIKTQTGDWKKYIENYKTSLRNLAACGIKVIIYNFMPVLDWIRTNLKYTLADGSRCLRFEAAQFAAFDMFVLKRENAQKDYSDEIRAKAKAFFDSLTKEQISEFESSIMDVFPGCKLGLKAEDLRKMLAKYKGIDEKKLKENLAFFLREVSPVAASLGQKLAIHPDDPPFDVLGLPRIASNVQDFKDIVSACDNSANGICFCAGSLSANPKNDLPSMIDQLKDKIFCVHLRSTKVEPDGSFYEAGHLEGGVPMPEVVSKFMEIQAERKAANDVLLVFRPDHGRDMADDLSKKFPDNPGYNFIGRMKGLAEIRGLMRGIMHAEKQ